MFDQYDAPWSPLLRDIAARLGATVRGDRGTVYMMRDGVEVTATTRAVAQDAMQLDVVATAAPPGLPRFHLYVEGFRSFIGKLFGARDVELGERDFDLRYMVKADDEDLLRRCLTVERCRAVVAVRASELTSDGDRLVLARRTEPLETLATLTAAIEPACALLLDLGGADVYGRAVLAGLPDATFWATALPRVDIAGPGDIRVGFTRDRDTVAMEARATLPGLAELPVAWIDRVRALGGVAGRTDDGAAIAWPTVVREAATLTAAIELLRELATVPHAGVFR